MDAKPHRPARTLKLRDENAPPSILPGKTLHQRNKSSPALSTLVQAGGAKFGAKRSAFADISNTRNQQSVKDDTALYGKNPGLSVVKEVSAPEDTKPAPFLRPAQRPLSIQGIKGFLNNLSSSNNSFNPPKTALPSIPITTQESLPTVVPHKVVVPKKSTIFREPAIPTVPYTEHAPVASVDLNDKPLPVEPSSDALEVILPLVTPAASEPINVPAPSSSHDALATISESDTLPPSDIPVASIQVAATALPLDVSLAHPTVSEAETILAEENSSVNFGSPEIYEDAAAHIIPLGDQLHQEIIPAALEQCNAAVPDQSDYHIDNHQILPQTQPYPVEANYPLPESEFEYWEEDAYDERCDDDGYTTARSLKSRGDYTTGGTTTILAPRVTAAVEREIAAARQFIQESRTADEIEEDESWDTSMVAEYGDEIFEYMRTLEEHMRPNPYYMDNQTEVQWSMRSVLMDWLVQVHHRFSLLPETLFLCVNYIDRFLSCKVVSLGKLQLVGATAIFIAAKYEEINCPSIQEIVYMVDGGYTVDEILKAERFMLSMLQFELGWPGPMSFLRRVSKADDYDLETRTLAKYFLEITIMDERFVGCIPSYIAAGSHCLARLMLKKGTWSQAHVYYSNYTYSQLRPLLSAILSCCDDPQKHHAAIFEKYGDKRFKRASFFVQTEVAKGFNLPPVARTSLTSPSSAGGLSVNHLTNQWRLK